MVRTAFVSNVHGYGDVVTGDLRVEDQVLAHDLSVVLAAVILLCSDA
jgi:hypothetical protein